MPIFSLFVQDSKEPYVIELKPIKSPDHCGCGEEKKIQLEIFYACVEANERICDSGISYLCEHIVLHKGKNEIIINVP